MSSATTSHPSLSEEPINSSVTLPSTLTVPQVSSGSVGQWSAMELTNTL